MKTTVAAFILSCMLTGTAFAQSVPPSPAPSSVDLAHDRIDGIWQNRETPSWFSASFLAQVPFDRIQPIVAQLLSALGTYQTTSGGNGIYTSKFSKGLDVVHIHLDADQKIDGLLLDDPQISK